MLFADRHNLVHIRYMAVQMHHHHRFRLFRDLFFYLIRINLIIRIRFHKYRRCPVHGNPHHTGNISIPLHNNFVPCADSQKMYGNLERLQAVRHPCAVFCPGVGCKPLLKSADFLPQHIPPRAQNFQRLVLKFLLIF